MRRLPCRRHGIHRGRKELHRPLRDAGPRAPMAGLRAPTRERLLLAHHSYQTRQLEMRARPRQPGDQQHPAALPAGPHQWLFARYLGTRRTPRHDHGCLRSLPPPIAPGTQLPGLSQMNNSRRDIFKFAGGAVAGALFTPAPWRLITDSALWSENWPGIPRPARGEIRARFTNCALCPAGCAVRARCVGDQPVSLAGVGGGLCPFGLTAHHLPYHPARLKQGPIEEARAAVSQANQDAAKQAPGAIAVLDLNPGRTVSWTYRRAMASLKGLYLAPESHPVAYDLSAAKTVLSIGAPLLDGWGTPANVLAARPNFRLIQAEAVESRTAMLADEWIRIAPGTESAFAQSIPSLAYAKDIDLVLGDAPETPEITRQLGACGKTVFARPEAPVPESWIKNAAAVTELDGVPDHSISLLLIDESSAVSYIPWHQIQRKLVRENPLVVTFAVTRGGYARYAQYALPTAVYPEVLDDIAPAVDSIHPTFRIAVPLVPAPAGVVNPADFVSALAGLSAANALRERADAVHHTAQGAILTYADAKQTPLKDLTADAFWKSLNEGAKWDRPPGLSSTKEVG